MYYYIYLLFLLSSQPDTSIAQYDSNAYVGFELWQVKAGSIFSNILVTDDVAAADAAAAAIVARAPAEKAKLEEIEKAKKEAEEAAKKEADAKKEAVDEDDKKGKAKDEL